MSNSLFGSLFGGSLGNSMSGALGGNIANAAQQQAAHNPYMNQTLGTPIPRGIPAYLAQQQIYQASKKPKWVVDGVVYETVAEFADAVFGDTPARTLFLLKYEENKKEMK